MSSMTQVEVLRAACCVAGADESTTDRERVLLEKLARQCGVGKASLEAMIDRACSDQSFCQEQFRVLKAQPQQAMSALLDVAMADGTVDDNETQVLRVLSERLNVPSDIFDDLIVAAKAAASSIKTDD